AAEKGQSLGASRFRFGKGSRHEQSGEEKQSGENQSKHFATRLAGARHRAAWRRAIWLKCCRQCLPSRRSSLPPAVRAIPSGIFPALSRIELAEPRDSRLIRDNNRRC